MIFSLFAAIKTGRYTLEHKAGLLKQAGTRQVSTAPLPDYRGALSPSHQPFDAEGTTNSNPGGDGSNSNDTQVTFFSLFEKISSYIG